MLELLKIVLIAVIESIISWLVTRWLDDHFDKQPSWLVLSNPEKIPSVLQYRGDFCFSTKMLELLNSPLLSHMLYSIVKKEVFYIFIIHPLSY